MRLIDADKLELKHFVQWADVVVGYNGTQPKHKHTDIIAYDISGAPTVDAIPIEWIKQWMVDNWELECNYGIEGMIDDWEEEQNECRGTDKLD